MVQGPPQTSERQCGRGCLDGRGSVQQWRYRLHLMRIMEVSMVYNGVAVVSVFLLL